jgi:hypothetical protein
MNCIGMLRTYSNPDTHRLVFYYSVLYVLFFFQKKLEKTLQSPAGKSEKPVNTRPSKSDTGGFGGFKKGFLFGGNSSSKPKVKSSSSGSNVKSSSEMPYITQKSADQGHKLPEVQQTLTKEAQKMADSKGNHMTCNCKLCKSQCDRLASRIILIVVSRV